MNRFELVARSLRGGLTECWHFGAVAIVDPDGLVVARLGDPEVPVFMRSAAKPLQAIAMMELGLDRFELDPIDVALVCASHGGCELHTTRVSALLDRRGLAPHALLCGPQPPLDPQAAGELLRRGLAPTQLHNNCSGKHAGMLLTCLEAGLSVDDYVEGHHPLQQRIAATVARFCRIEAVQLGVGTDGCSVPTFRVPLAAVALTYAGFADPSSLPDSEDGQRAERIFSAMTTAPEMVAGPGRFTTRLMEVAGGSILAKEGADGVYALACRGDRPLGVALKIADGTEVCRDGVVLDVLEQLGILTGAALEELAEFRRPERVNRSGAKIGEVVPEVALELDAKS